MKNTLLLVFLIVPTLFQAQASQPFFERADRFFNTYVQNGRVDYKALKQDPTLLDELVDLMADVTISHDDENNFQAFWINAYNLFTIKGIVNSYPVKSPMDIPGFFDKRQWKAGGMEITLNDIENKMLRGYFPHEPRFHFVLVCAGLGCPPIISNAYFPHTLDTQLQEQTVKALNDPNFVRTGKKKVGISQIFEWYTTDFTQGGTSIIEYINQYRKEPLPTNAKTYFYSYDWSLNAIR